MTRRRPVREVADFDYGHRDPSKTSQFSIDSFDFKGRGDLKTRPVPGHYADNPMYDASRLTETDDEDASALDRLHAMLSAADVGDDEIAGGARLTPDGARKVAAKLGIAAREVDLLLASLAQRVRKDREGDIQAAYEAAMDARPARYAAEEDYLGNVTVRDARTGANQFLRGSRAADLLRRADGQEGQRALASVFKASEPTAPADAGWDIQTGPVTYNFSWERDGEHGTATAKFALGGSDGKARIQIVQARDHQGRRVPLDDAALLVHLEAEAREFIGRE